MKDSGLVVKRPESFEVPTGTELEAALPSLIETVATEQKWPADRVTRVTWDWSVKTKKESTKDTEKPTETASDE